MEFWKPMQSYEGYFASDQGRFKSIKRVSKGYKEKILSLSPDSNGYAKTGVSCNGKAKTIRCHREVAICFIPNPDNLLEVNHKNGDKMDCSASNLEWVSAEGNREHYKKELLNKKSGADNLSPKERHQKKAIEHGVMIKESGRFAGANNPNAGGEHKISFDNGTSIVVDNLTEWCKQSGIYDYRNVYHVKRGGYYINYKGKRKWKTINRHNDIIKVEKI
jgi:hypothetical protein